ncbi:hypothetical protein K2P47_02710 [Patescibacteria group bacterium]|nr:hypothetical protein [Patescibacteria group bacterium]
MKIKLYTNVYEDAHDKNLKYLNLTIKGKLVHYFVSPSNLEEEMRGVYENSWREFLFQKDDKYYYLFPDLRLNTRVKISYSNIHNEEDSNGVVYQDESFIAGKEGFCHLNLFQSLILNFRFKKFWFQNEENLKWVISTIVASAVAAGALSAVF